MHPLLPVSLFTGLYLTLASAFALSNGNTEFIFYIVVVLLLAILIYVFHRRVALPSSLLWALSIWGLLHMLGGLLPVPEGWPINGDKRVLYSLWLIPELLKYDHIVHAYGFGIATWACWVGLSHALQGVRPTLGMLLLCSLAGMGLGAVNELIEFIAVLAIPNTNVGGYVNTGWDLVANLVGSCIAAVLIKLKTA